MCTGVRQHTPAHTCPCGHSLARLPLSGNTATEQSCPSAACRCTCTLPRDNNDCERSLRGQIAWVRTAELLAPRGCGGGPVAARLDVIIGTRPAVIVRLQRRAVAVFGAGQRQTLRRNMLFQLCCREHARLRSEQASEAGAADLSATRFELAHRVAGGVHLAADRPGAARHLLVPGPSVPLEQCAGWCSGGLWAPHLFR